MGDLKLSGTLNFSGDLKLKSDGKVLAEGKAVLLEMQPGSTHGDGGPVILPPPPVGPVDTGTGAVVFKSFNASVKVQGANAVTMGIHLQGDGSIWPGMVLPSSNNTGVTVNGLPLNVEGDSGITLPNGGSVTYSSSGQ